MRSQSEIKAIFDTPYFVFFSFRIAQMARVLLPKYEPISCRHEFGAFEGPFDLIVTTGSYF
jgi:hypothetical protein